MPDLRRDQRLQLTHSCFIVQSSLSFGGVAAATPDFFGTEFARGDIKMTRHCPPSLDSRCRDANGEIRHKNGNTRVGTLRDTYGDEFASGHRADMKLRTLLDRSGAGSLSDYLKRPR